MTIECSQSVHSIDIRPVYYGVQMVICGGKSRFHSVSTWFLGILLCKVKGIGFSNRIRYLAGSFTKTRNRIVKRTGRDPVLSTPCRIRQTALPALSHQFHPFWVFRAILNCHSGDVVPLFRFWWYHRSSIRILWFRSDDTDSLYNEFIRFAA